MPSQQKQTRLFPCANAVSLQEARPAAAALSARLPVSPRGSGATMHLPRMSSRCNILDTTHWPTETEGGRREGDGETRGSGMHVLARHVV